MSRRHKTATAIPSPPSERRAGAAQAVPASFTADGHPAARLGPRGRMTSTAGHHHVDSYGKARCAGAHGEGAHRGSPPSRHHRTSDCGPRRADGHHLPHQGPAIRAGKGIWTPLDERLYREKLAILRFERRAEIDALARTLARQSAAIGAFRLWPGHDQGAIPHGNTTFPVDRGTR
jgi:hypothetical protein